MPAHRQYWPAHIGWYPGFFIAVHVLVTADPASSYLKPLEQLPPEANVIISDDRDRVFAAATEADVLLNADFRDPRLFLETFPRASRAQWAHVVSAGVESVLSPE